MRNAAGAATGSEISYVNGRLHMDGVDLSKLANDPAVSTPVYVYSRRLMRRRLDEFTRAVRQIDPTALVCFAVKSLSNQAVLQDFASWGAGADLVTRGELERALAAGFEPNTIVFSGLGKTRDDLDRAVRVGVQVNVESISELELLNDCAKNAGAVARVAFRLNPQLDDMRTELGQITTGKPDSKFGIPWTAVVSELKGFRQRFPHLSLVGASIHLGSNMEVTSENRNSFANAFQKLSNEIFDTLSAYISGPVVFDLGGGVGIDYEQEPVERGSAGGVADGENRWLETYAGLVREAFADKIAQGKVRLIFEPGRLLSGECGVLLSRVLHVKLETEKPREVFGVRFLIVDAGMNDLARPSLYGAYHHIVPVLHSKADCESVDISGAACETTDSFMRPTKEYLSTYSNIFSSPDADEMAKTANKRHLKAANLEFREIEPKEKTTNTKRTYEYFVKRRFPSAVKQGDLVAILNAGAYGAVMASEYNTRPLIPEVLVDGDKYAVIRHRPTLEEIIARDIVPTW